MFFRRIPIFFLVFTVLQIVLGSGGQGRLHLKYLFQLLVQLTNSAKGHVEDLCAGGLGVVEGTWLSLRYQVIMHSLAGGHCRVRVC